MGVLCRFCKNLDHISVVEFPKKFKPPDIYRTEVFVSKRPTLAPVAPAMQSYTYLYA